jgi:hypothetical protein
MLLEFNAESFVGRAMQPRTESLNDLTGKNLQVGNLAQIVMRKKVGNVRDGSSSS